MWFFPQLIDSTTWTYGYVCSLVKYFITTGSIFQTVKLQLVMLAELTEVLFCNTILFWIIFRCTNVHTTEHVSVEISSKKSFRKKNRKHLKQLNIIAVCMSGWVSDSIAMSGRRKLTLAHSRNHWKRYYDSRLTTTCSFNSYYYLRRIFIEICYPPLTRQLCQRLWRFMAKRFYYRKY